MREAQRDFTHTLLVDAAIRAFARHGYHKTTIEQIVVEAGASRATFYLYFRDLFRPVYDATAVDPDLYRSLFPDGLPGVENMIEALLKTDLALEREKLNVFTAALFSLLLYYFRRHLRGDAFNREVVAEVIADLWSNLIANARKR